MQRARLATKREHSLAGRRVHLTAAAAANIQANMWGAAGGHSRPELSITIPAAEANQAQTHTSAGKHFGWPSAEMKPGRYFRRPSRAPTSQVKREAQAAAPPPPPKARHALLLGASRAPQSARTLGRPPRARWRHPLRQQGAALGRIHPAALLPDWPPPLDRRRWLGSAGLESPKIYER